MRLNKIKKTLLLVIGNISLALGVIGVFLPLVPTTPFLLVAAWCFMNSSPRLNQWLLNHPQFGPAIQAWREEKAIPFSAKVLATVTALFSVALSWTFTPIIYVNIAVTILLSGVILFVWTRPTPRHKKEPPMAQ